LGPSDSRLKMSPSILANAAPQQGNADLGSHPRRSSGVCLRRCVIGQVIGGSDDAGVCRDGVTVHLSDLKQRVIERWDELESRCRAMNGNLSEDQLKDYLADAVAETYHQDDLEADRDPEARQHLLHDLNHFLAALGR
jgi:hypothetical protein